MGLFDLFRRKRPGAQPPPIPTRGAPPPFIPLAGPPPLPSPTYRTQPDIAADPNNFSPDADRISTRDVQRVTGSTEGKWFHFDSTNVLMAKADPYYDLDGNKTGTALITVVFLSLAKYEYPDRPMGEFYDLIESQSKGRYAHYVIKLRWKPFTKINGPLRRVTREMIAARQPKTARQKTRRFTVGGKRSSRGKGGRP